jgi:predicted P-loop ATPase/GTPase
VTLLVAGGDRVDAGKTTFAAGLLHWLPEATAAFKPRAGNDFWFDHDDARTALSAGRVYGKDVARLVDAAGSDAVEESRNPIHRLWKPTPGRTGMLGERGRTFLLDRVKTPDGTVFVVNENTTLPELVRESLPISEQDDTVHIPDDDTVHVRRVSSVPEFNEVMREYHLPALERVAATVRQTEPAVVESYADIADPLRGVSYEAVCVVEPGRCRVYDGDRWEIACETVAGDGREGKLEERVGTVTEMLDPVETVPLSPLTAQQRSDPAEIAPVNEPAYEALLSAADTAAPSLAADD